MSSIQETLFNVIENKSMHMNKALENKTIYKVDFFHNKNYQSSKTTRNRATAYGWQFRWQQKGSLFCANVSTQKG